MIFHNRYFLQITWSVLILTVLAVTVQPCLEGANEDEAELWDLIIDFQFNHAAKALEERLNEGSQEGNYRMHLGYALALLNVNPRTEENINKAESVLLSIRKKDPNSEAGIAALYFLGRIASMYSGHTDIPKACAFYRTLIEENPGHFWSQMAASKYVMLQLYEPVPAAEKKRRFDEIEGLKVDWSQATLESQFHAALGFAAMRFSLGDEKAYRHFLRVIETEERFGRYQSRFQEDVLIALAEFARKTGRNEVALHYYREMLRVAPNDRRNTMVKDRIRNLESQVKP